MINTSVRAEPPEDWLATLIRRILHTWIDDAEPPPDVWTRIRRCIEATTPSTLSIPPFTWRRHIMFPNELEFLVHQEHYKDLLREAERARLVRQMQAGQERRNHLYCRALTWLGGQLVGWGWRLQERYGTVAGFPALRVANRSR